LNFFGLSPGELFLILVVAMIVLGPEKLPETAGSIGKWIREFRRATQELTQQFADDNPFAELQRALQLDEPIVINGPTTTPTAEVPAAVAAAPVASVATVEAPVAPVAAVSAPVRSDYFDRPGALAAVEDRWTHAGLADVAERITQRQRPVILAPVADEWAHGVPTFGAPPLPPTAEESTTPGIDLPTMMIAPYVYEPQTGPEPATNGVSHSPEESHVVPDAEPEAATNGVSHWSEQEDREPDAAPEPASAGAGAASGSTDPVEEHPE
jgi:Tat protein translocase TatB subunit